MSLTCGFTFSGYHGLPNLRPAPACRLTSGAARRLLEPSPRERISMIAFQVSQTSPGAASAAAGVGAAVVAAAGFPAAAGTSVAVAAGAAGIGAGAGAGAAAFRREVTR
jgi:hypothetical protein